VLDVIDEGGERPFKRAGDAAFNLFRAEAGVLPGDGNNGNIDVGEDIRGCPKDQHGRRDENQYR